MVPGIAIEEEQMGLTQEDVERILRIIDESGYDEIRIEYGELKLHVRRRGAASQVNELASAAPRLAPPDESAPATAPAQPKQAGAVGSPAPVAEFPRGSVLVRAPMLGTFYRASSPGGPPFVEIGSEVRADTTVCLIEVMKLFNSLKAGVDGRVMQILVENGAMVEYEQLLIVIEPKANQ